MDVRTKEVRVKARSLIMLSSFFITVVFSLLAEPLLAAEELIPSATLIRIWSRDLKQDAQVLGSRQYDICGYDLKANTVDILARDDELSQLRSEGFAIEVLKTPEALRTDRIDPEYLTPTEVEQLLTTYEANYPAIVKRYNIGTTHESRSIWAVKISDNVASDEDEPELMFNAEHHAREVMTPEITMDIIDYLTTNYGSDPQVTGWVDELEIWVVPMVNPDGNAYCWSTYSMWRKNRRNNGGSYGVDVNRNYPFLWGSCGGSSGTPSSDTYRGPSAGSEPETQAIMALALDRRFVFSISYHSYSELVIYPYGCDGAYTANHEIYSTVGTNLASLIQRDSGTMGYSPGTAWQLLYSVDGDDLAWLHGVTGDMGFVIEVNSATQGFQPAYSWRDPTVLRNRPGWMYLLNRLQGSQIWGHTIDACTGEPVQATIVVEEFAFSHGESARTSDPLFGRYHVVTIPGTYHLNFSAPGYYDLSFPIEVGSTALEQDAALVPTDQYGLMVHHVTVDDTASGDADGVLDPGEQANLVVTALATGGAVTNVSATLTCSDPYITILNSTTTFPGIGAGGTADSIAPHFSIQVSANTPEFYPVSFDTTFTADQSLCYQEGDFTEIVSSYVYGCPLFEETLDENPQWTIENIGPNGWAFGIPSSGPGAAHTGQNVYATNLSGNYGDNGQFWLTTTPFNCLNIRETHVHFWRYLKNETGYDTAFVQVSTDGSTFNTVWSGYGDDTQWTEITLDIAEYADQQPEVYLRFGLVTDTNTTRVGFYLDDVGICGRGEGAPLLRMSEVSVDDQAGPCSDADGSLDAGEEADIAVTLSNSGVEAAFGTSATLTTTNPHLVITNPVQDYGVIPASGGSVTRTYHVVANSTVTCLETAVFTVVMATGQYTFDAGFRVTLDTDTTIANTTYTNDFEQGAEGWTTNGWTTSTTRNHTPGGAESMFSTYSNSACSRLESPSLQLTSGMSHQLTFWTAYAFESSWDGGIVQVSVDGGAWTKLNLTPTYPSTSSTSTSACIGAGVTCFSASNLTWTQYSADLSSYSGSPVTIGFLFGTDGSVTAEGWYIDDVAVSNVTMMTVTCDEYPCEQLTPSVTPLPTNSPTPTPSLTRTATATSTATPTPTTPSTLTPTLTPTGSLPPTVTPTPTATATEAPTLPATATPTEPPSMTPIPNTQAPTSTPTEITPSPTAGPEQVAIRLELNQEMYHAGEQFLLLCSTYSPDPATQVEQYIILDVYQNYWFWPSWTQDLAYQLKMLPYGRWETETILDFTWPFGAGSATDIMFWAAFLEPGTINLLGEISTVSFDFE